MGIEKFKQLLTEHKCVMVEFCIFPSSSLSKQRRIVMHYELEDSGLILECYDDRTLYPVCNIHNEQAMADLADSFNASGIISMKPGKPTFLQLL